MDCALEPIDTTSTEDPVIFTSKAVEILKIPLPIISKIFRSYPGT